MHDFTKGYFLMFPLHKASLALAFFSLLGLAANNPATAQISGFGNGSGFTLNTNGNGSPSISGGTFQVTTNAGNEAASAYYDTKQKITSFTADFTLTSIAVTAAAASALLPIALSQMV